MQQKLFKLMAILIALSMMLVPLTPLAAQAQEETPGPAGDALAPLPVLPPLESDAPGLWVVRVYYENRAQVDEIAATFEPWEVNTSEGYLVIEVTQAQYEAFVAQGYRVEVDHKLTAELNQTLEPLPGQVNGIPSYPCYRTVEETFQTAADIAANYPHLAEWIDVGDSWDKLTPGGLPGYDMMVLRLTNENITLDKPKLFIMTAVHAREYTTAELNTRFAEYLIANYNIDPDVTWLLDYTEVHLMLHANPDGRKQAETGLLWRKNTNQNYCGATSTSRGADLNRNFEFYWGCCGGSSTSPCSETYRGPLAASEPETQAIQDYVRTIFPDQRADPLTSPAPDDAMGIFLDVHSYSELVLWAWGFTASLPPNSTQLQTLGRKFAYFNGYMPQQAVGLYPTDGSTDDFAYGDLGVAAYTFELGTAFFQSCSVFENTIVPNNMPSLLYAAKASNTPYMTPAGPDALDVVVLPNMAAPGDAVTLNATLNDTRYSSRNGAEPAQNIVTARYYIDEHPWHATSLGYVMSAADGSFNSPVENATAVIDTSGLSNGRHTIYVRGQDAAGNWGAISATFLYVIDPITAPVLKGYVRETLSNAPLAATVSVGSAFQAQTDPATGFYQMYVISGTYDLQATADGYGTQTIEDVSVGDQQVVNQNFSLVPMCAAFSDDAEGGNTGWTAQSPWAITTENSHSPTHSWTDSPGANYGNYLNLSLTSPTLDLTGFSDIHLDFWQICDTEADWDYCHVEISDNNGATWTEIGTYDGNHSQWENINLAAALLDNQPDARIRFRLTSDSNTVDNGWHLDDIQLLGAGEACVVYTPATAHFSSNSPTLLGEATQFTNLSYGTDLAFAWNFGDGSPVISETNPAHTFPATGWYSVALTATNALGSDVFRDWVEVYSTASAQLTLEKTANLSETLPGGAFTYTLRVGILTTGTHTYTLSLQDDLPPEVIALTETIRLDGEAAPQLYDLLTHRLALTQTGTLTDTAGVTITLQVVVGTEVLSGTRITNQVNGHARVGRASLLLQKSASVTVAVFYLPRFDLFLPVISR